MLHNGRFMNSIFVYVCYFELSLEIDKGISIDAVNFTIQSASLDRCVCVCLCTNVHFGAAKQIQFTINQPLSTIEQSLQFGCIYNSISIHMLTPNQSVALMSENALNSVEQHFCTYKWRFQFRQWNK